MDFSWRRFALWVGLDFALAFIARIFIEGMDEWFGLLVALLIGVTTYVIIRPWRPIQHKQWTEDQL